VALSWKSIDSETKDYCVTVASILKERHAELYKEGGINYLSRIDPDSPGPKKKTEPQSGNNTTKYSEPVKFRGTDFVEMIQQMPPGLIQHGGGMASLPITTGGDGYNELEFPIITNVNRRAMISNMMVGTRSFQEQPICQVNAPRHEKNGSLGEHRRSSAPELLLSTQERQLKATYKAQECVSVKMLQQMPPGLIQHGCRMASLPITTGGDGYYELEFPIITNVNRRAMISNMMAGTRSFQEEPICQVNAPRHEENGSLRERRWSSVPELLISTQEKQFKATYKVQELDIPDGDVLGMWESN
jgi:hypothetical protein